jgi:histidine ammonia-lyase
MLSNSFIIDNNDVTIHQIKSILKIPHAINLSNESILQINNCFEYLQHKTSNSNHLYYGINTGFGFLQNVAISQHQTQALQYNLLMSHACGIGSEVPSDIVKLMLLLKIKSLSYGYSGVQLATVQRLIDLYNHKILPVVYTQGSLGASGDLSPLSHLCLPIIGMGEVRYEGEKIGVEQLYKQLNWTPIALQNKEGLALINGTQFMSAYGIYCLQKSERLLHWANVIAAISLDAFNGSIEPFHPSIHKIRKQKGQIKVAVKILELLKNSSIANQAKNTVQDPYSFRCIPQVHGASLDTYEFVLNTFLNEINAVTDNPNIFPDEDLIASGGNFHGQPLALGLDYLAIAMSEIANISERRTYQLISGQRELPLFLIQNPGLHSGFMIPQYTAASIVSQNKQLCTPASVDSISSSNNQEDHVSMGANAATKCLQVVDNVEKVLAIELLCAVQALTFRKPQQTAPYLQKIADDFQAIIPFNSQDRILHHDIMASLNFLQTYEPI